MRFAILGSGSGGNASVVESSNHRVMIDCGFALSDVCARAKRLDIDPATLDAILLTHEHGDHASGVGRLARKYDIPVYLTPGTRRGARDLQGARLHTFTPHESFAIGDLQVQPFPVPHDAREPCQFVIKHQKQRVGVLSDLGSITVHVKATLMNCDALMLEANHDPEMLRNGPYPAKLKKRVGGNYGHLSNQQAASLLRAIRSDGLQKLVLTHLSEKNNTPQLARAAICEVLEDDPAWCVCASQNGMEDWTVLD